MRNRTIQSQITAGRLTLPVVIFTCIACWVITSFLLPDLPVKDPVYSLWNDLYNRYIPEWTSRVLSFTLFAIIGYFLIELNNTFAIIRMRASVQTSLFFMLITACPGLHLLYPGDIAAGAFLISVYFLFKSYQQLRPAGYLFHSFLFIGAGSLIFPQLTFFIPIWLIGANNFQALTFRSFCGALTGWSVPYWFLLGHAFFHNRMELFYQPFIELATFQPIRFTEHFQLWEAVTLGYIFILFIVSAVHFIAVAYEDKIQTRSYLNFLIFLTSCIFVFIVLQPGQSMNLLPMLLIGVSILVGHLFVLTGSRSSNYFFIGSMSVLILLFLFNVWMLL